MTDTIKDLLKFLQIGARLDLKAIALENVLGFTGSEEGLTSLIKNPELLSSLICLLGDNTVVISKDAALSLVNISANKTGAKKLLDVNPSTFTTPLQSSPDYIVCELLKHITNKDSYIADHCCMILSNLTRPSFLIDKVIDFIEKSEITFDDLINTFTKNEFNSKGAKLHYLGPVLSNLSQSSRVRKYILEKDACVIQRLLPFTEYKESLVRRGGIIGTLKNCCFESDYHEWMLSDNVDILPRLLLPLAGSEEFDDEDNDKLPLDLQYLPETKTREEDPDIRCILLEAITQLCSKRCNREYIRDKNAYVILRELHKWEKDKEVLLACENLVDILIRTEDEIGEDNLKAIIVPEEVKEKLAKLDDIDKEEYNN